MKNDYIEVPILDQFDQSSIIGYVRIEKEYVSSIPDFGLAAGFIPDQQGKAKKLISFGFVRQYVPPAK